MLKYFYGGQVSGRVITPDRQQGVITRPNRISITTSVVDAALIALSEVGNVYEVKPIGRVEVDKDGESDISYLCKRAKVVRQFKWSEVKQYLRFELADVLEAQDQEKAMREESEVQ